MSEQTTPALSLAAKMSKVSAHCAYVQKDKRNEFHRYSYASAAAILEKVNEALAEHRICATVNPTIESSVEVTTARGGIERVVTVRAEITLHDGDSDQTLTTSGLGSGQDAGDKAVMKAQTAALKYAWLGCLSISTGDDPEGDDGTDKAHAPAPAPRPAQQRPAAQATAPRPAAPAQQARPAQEQAATPDDDDPFAGMPATRAAPRVTETRPPPVGPGNADLATPAQVRAAYLIGRNERGMDDAAVDARSVELYGVAPAELSKKQASGLITALKGGSAAAAS